MSTTIKFWSSALDAANLIGWRALAQHAAEQLILAMIDEGV